MVLGGGAIGSRVAAQLQTEGAEVVLVEGDASRAKELAERLNESQIVRIREGRSKTRLSILFYAVMGNCLMISKQSLRLVDAFEETFGTPRKQPAFDLD